MSGALRAWAVVAVVAVASWGEGGAAAPSLLLQHVLLAAAVAVCLFALPAADHSPSRAPAMAWLAFAALAAIGALVAPYAYAAWLVIVEILSFTSLAWLATADPAALSRILPHVLAALAAAHGLAALAQKLRGSPRPASSFMNPNHLSAWLVAAVLFLAAGLLAREGSTRARTAQGAAMAIALAGIFVTGSRGAVLGLIAGAAALVALVYQRMPSRARRPMLASAAALILVAVAGVALRFRTDTDPFRFHRTRIWAAALGGALRSPWLGSGPGQFAVAARNLNFPLEDTPLRFERAFSTPHSDVLRAVSEFGFPAGLAAFTAAGLAGLGLYRRRLALSAVECGAIAGLASLAAQGCVDDLTTRPALTLTGAAFVGLLIAKRRDDTASGVPRAAAQAIAALVVLALGVGEIAGYAAWRDAGSIPRGRLDAAQLGTLQRALRWNPMLPDLWQRLSEHFAGDGRSWSVEDYAAAREATEHARRLQPLDAVYARAAARLEANACLSIFPFQTTRDRAVRLYEEAVARSRTDATIPLEEAKFLLQAGDAAGSERASRRALELEPRAAVTRVWLAQAILKGRRAGAAGEAQKLLDEALALAPRAGEAPTSPYDASLRWVDPTLVGSLRGELAGRETP